MLKQIDTLEESFCQVVRYFSPQTTGHQVQNFLLVDRGLSFVIVSKVSIDLPTQADRKLSLPHVARDSIHALLHKALVAVHLRHERGKRRDDIAVEKGPEDHREDAR